MFAAALEEIVERLTPDNAIRALHTRTIQNGGAWYLVTIGDFAHVVVRGNGKDKTLDGIKGLLTMASAKTTPPRADLEERFFGKGTF